MTHRLKRLLIAFCASVLTILVGEAHAQICYEPPCDGGGGSDPFYSQTFFFPLVAG